MLWYLEETSILYIYYILYIIYIIYIIYIYIYIYIYKQMPTFNVLVKNISRIKINT